MTDIAKLVLQADTSQMKGASRALKDVSKQAKDTAVDVDSMAFRIGSTLRRLAGPAAIGAAVVGLATLVKSAINTADELSKASQSIGIGTEELSRLRYAADLSGVSFENLQSSLNIMNRNLGDLTGKGNAATKALAQMGIDSRDSSGNIRSSTDILADMSDVFQTMPDGAQKSALAMAVLGRSGAQMIPMLNMGADGIRSLTEEAEQFGIVIDAETGRKAEAFNDNLTRLSGVFGALGAQIAAEMLPTLVDLTDFLVKNTDKIRDFARAVAGTITYVSQIASGVGVLVSKLSGISVGVSNFAAPALDILKNRIITTLGPLVVLVNQLQKIGAVSQNIDAVGLGAGNSMKTLGKIIGDSGVRVEAASQSMTTLGDVGADTSAKLAKGLNKASDATRIVEDRLRAASQAAKELRSDVSGLFDQLFPEEARFRRTMEDIGTLFKARREGIISDDQFKRAGDQITEDTTHDSVKKVSDAAEQFKKEFFERSMKVKKEALTISDSFAQMSQRITSSLQGLANSIRSGDIVGILGGVLNIFTQLGSAGVFGTSMQTRLNAPTNRSMGGPVQAGRPYMVGERGPELFMPGSQGRIVPNNDNGFGSTVMNISVDARGATSPEMVRQQVRDGILEAAPSIVAAAQQRTISTLRRPKLAGAL